VALAPARRPPGGCGYRAQPLDRLETRTGDDPVTSQGLQLLGDLRGTLRETLAGLGPLEPPVALIDFPNHGNVGDSAIWRGEAAWLRQTVGAPVFVCEIANYNPAQLHSALSNTGTILLHGGGNLGDLWATHQVVRERILDEFADRRVIQLPQSILFESGIVLESARRAFARHKRFTLLVREQRSLEFARREFQCDIRLCPDMAFALSPIPRPTPSTDLVLLARTDKESRLRPIPAGDLAPIDWLHDAASFARSLERRTRFWAPRWGLRRHLFDRLAAERLCR
jgi:pyruvyl transferase EpsO